MGDKKILLFGEDHQRQWADYVERRHTPSGQRLWGDNVILRVQSGTSRESRCACAGDCPGPVTDSDADPSTTEAPDSLAEAEAELARAEERAEAARARAAELRREAEAGSSEEPDATDDADELKPARWRPRPRWPWR